MTRIMIAEPSPELRLLFARALSRLDMEPVVLEDAVTAAPPLADAVLLDPDWPAGVAASRALGAPVIVCTTRGQSPDPAYAGAVAHVVKPFSQRQLARALRAALPAST